ncbi:hypothetical protein XA3_18350 [Xylocopilactobacillus apicola]|uniref:Uncharacterized protein n=1 Tax=Xylocopilactobacillus apicola TaxID=2932184 RepID=A0AAU9D6D8_9LACO|nr:hypothetical protein XA3_18350 [Xylocopilactobacillus apicola]
MNNKLSTRNKTFGTGTSNKIKIEIIKKIKSKIIPPKKYGRNFILGVNLDGTTLLEVSKNDR